MPDIEVYPLLLPRLKWTKIRYLFSALMLFNVLFIAAQSNYTLKIVPLDKDSIFVAEKINLQTQFLNQADCKLYLEQLLPLLNAKGYITASIDSVYTDTTFASVQLFFGEVYQWASVQADETSKQWLFRIGWNENYFTNKQYDPEKLATLQTQMLNYMENNGYPFAKIYIDNQRIIGKEITGNIHVVPGPLYYIDSIKITGNAKISNEYLQQFLQLKNGSIYNKEKLQRISSELKKLTYVEEMFPPQLIWHSTGGTVEVFLQQKKSSQINVIIGFLPNSDATANKKMLITGEGLLNLKNAFGGGETIGLVWQRPQAFSQRLHANFNQPYLFRSPFGMDFSFNMVKRDSAFLNIDIKLGTQVSLNRQQRATVYVQRFSNILNYINESEIITTQKLPEDGDVKATHIGLEYQINTTNYMFNPVKGFDLSWNGSVGNKKLKRNNQILDLHDPNHPDFNFASLYDTITQKSFQFRSILAAANYFPIGKMQRSTIKTAINAGYISGSNIFRNELFQIGGYRLLRGFDEQSQFLSQYGIGTIEYRYLIGQNSYFNIFADGGWGQNASREIHINYTYISAGMGLAFETKAGLFNLAWAVGKRNDVDFNFRKSKIHFGFVSYF